MKKVKRHCSVAERSFAAGALAECMKALKESVEPFVKTILSVFVTMFKDSDEDVRNNAVFGAGEMALHGGACIHQSYPAILGAFSGLLANEDCPRVIDQVVTGVCR